MQSHRFGVTGARAHWVIWPTTASPARVNGGRIIPRSGGVISPLGRLSISSVSAWRLDAGEVGQIEIDGGVECLGGWCVA